MVLFRERPNAPGITLARPIAVAIITDTERHDESKEGVPAGGGGPAQTGLGVGDDGGRAAGSLSWALGPPVRPGFIRLRVRAPF